MAARKSSKVNRKYKTRYRVQNWPEYERGLRVSFAKTLFCVRKPPRLASGAKSHL